MSSPSFSFSSSSICALFLAFFLLKNWHYLFIAWISQTYSKQPEKCIYVWVFCLLFFSLPPGHFLNHISKLIRSSLGSDSARIKHVNYCKELFLCFHPLQVSCYFFIHPLVSLTPISPSFISLGYLAFITFKYWCSNCLRFRLT